MTERHYRTLPSLCLGLLLALAALGWAAEATAQTTRSSIRAQLDDEARLAWDGAIELYEAGDYEGALVQLRRAHELSDNPRVLYDIGLSLKNLARYSLAVAAWKQELESKKELSRADVRALEAAIVTLEPFVSSLTVNCNEPGAIVSVDGVEVGRIPLLGPVPIDVGRRTVRLTKPPDFLPAEKQVDVVKGRPVELGFELERAVKVVEVSVQTPGAPGATIFVDGRELGASPYQGSVPVGSHTFLARAPGFEEALKTVEVVLGQPLRLTLAMAGKRTEGRLRVLTDQPDARIEIDGRAANGQWAGLLPAGGHRLVIQKEGYETYESDVALSAGQDRTLTVELKKSQSWVWWTVSLAVVVGGGAIATGYLLQPSETPAVEGTLRPGFVPF